ncbi:plasmodesmata-located protein 6 [Cryptomeria japonica]|uniref:plasmodesmata-located protein 6 n=1 Tax=Cryptomeria japonica TaxID=3369 RepID=UPI0025ACCB4A|nr:plasmodesmata-located protein 6 [Cryptomeria japonica]
MERRRRNGCLIVLKLLLVPLVSVYSQSFVYEGCSQEIYTEDSTYDNNLQSLLGTLVSQASNTKYYNISLDTSGNDAVYGLYQCRGDLGGRDCQNCIRNAQRQIAQVCVRTRGARIQMDGCSLHYDKVNFFGLADNSVIYKTCSGSQNGGTDFYAHLNLVLSGLQTGGFIGGNGFRLSNSGDSRTGYVHGLAQCEGDLSLTDCGTCMAAAVQRLRDVCGNAVSGQVYLSKCYARYSQDAFYRDNSSSDHHHDDNDDDAGKTVAIILGLLAGVALIVVFLSFLKQILKHGKG